MAGILSNWDFVKLGFCLTGIVSFSIFFSTGILSSGTLSDWDLVLLGLCLAGTLSCWGFVSWDYAWVGFGLLGLCLNTIQLISS